MPDHRWHIFYVINHTTAELLFGVSGDVKTRLQEHISGEVPATEHWSWSDHHIEVDASISWHSTQEAAVELVRAYEREVEVEGYVALLVEVG